MLGFLVLAAADSAIAQSADSVRTALVTRLYKQFSWEATGGDDGPEGRTFIDQPRRVLLRYLEPGLAELLLRERACVRESEAVCRLDFAPLWGSQDPDAAEISFSSMTGTPNAVVASIGSSSGAVTIVTYRMVRTRMGWRISDIQYARGASLRTILSDGQASRS